MLASREKELEKRSRERVNRIVKRYDRNLSASAGIEKTCMRVRGSLVTAVAARSRVRLFIIRVTFRLWEERCSQDLLAFTEDLVGSFRASCGNDLLAFRRNRG
jgi:hypothetical protein